MMIMLFAGMGMGDFSYVIGIGMEMELGGPGGVGKIHGISGEGNKFVGMCVGDRDDIF